MRLGIICEGLADAQVLPVLVRKLDPTISIVKPIEMGRQGGAKIRLTREAGKNAASLLQIDHCDRVAIVWDLCPRWAETESPFLWKDVRAIRASLKTHKVDPKKVVLICIIRELESWLIADRKALIKLITKTSHYGEGDVPRFSKPEEHSNPKGMLMEFFRSARRDGDYMPTTHAKQIAIHIECNNLRRCPTFRRFARKVAGYIISS